MAIKKLQNNFTTPDQSKKLLELGVPANSADCIRVIAINMVLFIQEGRNTEYYIDKYNNERNIKVEPCWSVGRLREIFCICSSVNGTREYPFCNSQIAWWITEFEFKKEFIDFSKLEE